MGAGKGEEVDIVGENEGETCRDRGGGFHGGISREIATFSRNEGNPSYLLFT